MAMMSKTKDLLEGIMREGSFKWAISRRTSFDEEFEEMGRSPSGRRRSIPELSPIANVIVGRCSRILDVSTDELQHNFNTEASVTIKHPSNYARNFFEYCCFRALALSTQVTGHLSDLKFRRLTFDMMLAWEAPSVRQASFKADRDSTVGIEAFSRIAPAIPIIADVITSSNLFYVLTHSTGGRLPFSVYEKYLGGLDRAIKKMRTRTESSLLSGFRSHRGERILDVDGTLTTQPVLEHVGISTWPGRLTLTDHVLYFEALKVVTYDKAKAYDLADDLKQVIRPELTGPWGSRLFDKAVMYKSTSISEPAIMEFPELTGHSRRDYWLAIMCEILYAHRFIRKFDIEGVEREETLSKVVLGILRLQAVQELVSSLPIKCETLLMFNLADQLPGGDLILETLADMTLSRGLDQNNLSRSGTGMHSLSALTILSNLGVMSQGSNDGKLLVGEIIVGEMSSLERIVRESRNNYKMVEKAQATVDGVKADGLVQGFFAHFSPNFSPMNSSQFMDKQVMGLAGSGTGGGELFDLMNPQEERLGGSNGGGVLKKEEILPSYDFQPIRTVGSSSSAVSNSGGANLDGGGRRSWGSADSKIASASLRYSNILEPHEPPPRVNRETDRDAYDVATVAEIDRTVKKYADNLLHSLEGVSARLSQLESRTRHLESSVDDLKDTIGSNSGSTDGKLRQLENILREVQTGVQVLRDKQEIAEAQLQLAKLQQSSSKADNYQPPPDPSTASAGQPDSRTRQQQPAPPPSYPPPPPAVAPPQPPSPFPAPNAPLPPPPTQQNPPLQFPSQLPQPQLTSVPSLPRESSYFSPGPQSMQPQPQSQPQPQTQPPPQPQHYQLPQYSPQMPPPQSLNPSFQLQLPPMPHHHPEESAPYMPPPPSQTYPPSIRQPAPLSQPPPASGPPQYYGSGQMPFPSSYAPPSGPSFSDSYPYSGSSSHYSSTMKPSPFSNSPPTSGGGGSSNSGNYSRLPTAKILPQAVPTGPSSGGGSGGRMPIDDVVDKVATMGFSREQVRATVRKLTENGQSVDLNVVLDKLMNDGGEMIQPQKRWFGQ